MIQFGYMPDTHGGPYDQPEPTPERRLEEPLEVWERAWTTVGPSAHHGKYFTFDAIHVTPKPFQRPRPPIWIGAFGPKSIARAGRLADGWTMAPFLDSVEAIKTN